ncbi:Hint domain-containing protein [Acidomonas methanolica]|uniref:Hint domain-containing protein n=1 Tax=Acidomonas methanolica TaxID=437 RepID=UPI00211A09CC|nr:Hint domain-containing protein [Acidomonas methanolica]MCQ9155397.1 Hint domain-containing protein [Acidomonas methanolica]
MTTTLNGAWSAVSTASGTVYESGSAVVNGPVALANGATLKVMSGATASGVNTISGGIATVVVSSGGELLSSYIQNGYVYVSSGGLTSGNQLNSDPTWIYSGASSVDDTYFNSGYDDNATYVFSGGTLNDATVTSGALANVYAGASASDIAVSSGGSAVLASGTTSGYTAYTGGNVTSGTSVYSGLVLPTADGSAVQNTVPVLGGVWSAVNTASGTVYESGSAVVGGPVALAGGAFLDVMSGATASGVNTISGGIATVIVSGGGELLNSYIQNGYVYVSSGGLTSGNQLNSDPTYIYSGASSVDDTYFNSGYGNDATYVYSGGTLNDATVTSGALAYVYAGASASNVAVSSGSYAYINAQYGNGSGGSLTLPNSATTLKGIWSAVSTASGTVYESGSAVVNGPVTLAYGATLKVMSGATASGVNTISGGIATVVVSSGGELLSSYIQNGYVSVNSGGITSGNQFNSDPTYISAGASSVDDSYFNSGYGTDVAYVSSGGTIVNPYISSGGYADVQSGGTVSSPTVTPGGLLTVEAGGALEVCFLPGTLIRTPVGEEAVENLRIGDEVSVHDYRAGRALSRKVTWIGNQKVAIRPGLSDDEAGYPVRILKDAIGEGVPFKDLLITPEHCLFFEGRFVPARMLVNGRSIFYDRSITSYTYYHIETEPHSVIWADGTLTESYLDTGNRKNFGQHGVVATLAGATAKSWTEDAGAALEVSRGFVEPVFRAIEGRAVEAGLKSHAVAPALTEEADLHLVTDKGQLIRLVRESEGHVTFMIPAGVESVRIVSRASRPSDVIGPFVDDRRLFGVAIGEVLLYEGGSLRDITAHLTDGELQGWQALEWADTRWTAGDALLPLGERRADAMALLILQIKAAGPYVVEDHEDQAACAI